MTYIIPAAHLAPLTSAAWPTPHGLPKKPV